MLLKFLSFWINKILKLSNLASDILSCLVLTYLLLVNNDKTIIISKCEIVTSNGF